MEQKNKLYTVAETAEILGTTPTAVYRLIYKKSLGCIDSMNKKKVSTLHIQEYMNKIKANTDEYYNNVTMKLL